MRKSVLFYVVDGNATSIFGRNSAIEFDLLRIVSDRNKFVNSNVNESQDSTVKQFISEYDQNGLFTGLGTFKGHEAKIYVDKSLPPVARSAQRLPF